MKEIEYINTLKEMKLDRTAINLNLRNSDYHLDFLNVDIKHKNKSDLRKKKEIYMDGSRMDNKVGSGLVVYNKYEESISKCYRLNDNLHSVHGRTFCYRKSY